MRPIGLSFTLLLACSSPGIAAWHEAKSKHFIIYADQRPEVLKAFATKLEKFDKAVRILRASDDPPIGDAGRLTIYVLSDTEAVSKLAVGKDSSIAGFYLARASGSVAFVPKKSGGGREWEIDADTIFFHEYAHHMMLQNADDAIPAWLVEGFAEFFSTAQFPKDGSVQLGTPANHRSYGLFALGKPSVEELLGKSLNRRSDQQMDALYGLSWLLTHYLTFDPSRNGQLPKYLGAFGRGDDSLVAARATFGDLKQLDKDLDLYLRRNKFQYLQVAGSRLSVDGIEVRPLRPGEAAMAPVRMRSVRGVNNKTAPKVAADARAAAAGFPGDPAVQTALAEAEFDVRNYAAAEAAADLALKADPAFAPAMIYKGKAKMEAAASKPDSADWKAIRSWFTKANRIDPEDAEPLMLFYESYRASGERPTKNAIDGLHYALLLVPQDERLRMMIVSQLMTDKRFAEARQSLAPLAYSPHLSDGRELAREIMDALGRDDPQAALAAMSTAKSDADTPD